MVCALYGSHFGHSILHDHHVAHHGQQNRINLLHLSIPMDRPGVSRLLAEYSHYFISFFVLEVLFKALQS
jgi:hypothetical protein